PAAAGEGWGGGHRSTSPSPLPRERGRGKAPSPAAAGEGWGGGHEGPSPSPPPRRVGERGSPLPCRSGGGLGWGQSPTMEARAVEQAVILAARRTPIGSFGGNLRELSPAALGAAAIRAALSSAQVEPANLDDVILGCVLQAGAGMNVARQAAVQAGVPVDVPAETVNRVCGSGLQAVVHAAEAIRGGFARMIVAGGTESMSRAPYLLPAARWGMRMG